MTHLQPGDKAPDFSGIDQNGDTITLADFKGEKVIIFFYPKDNTPTCTIEACNLRDNYMEFREKGFEVVGVSPDSARKHQNFIRKYDLPYTLLADTDKTIMNAYGVWGPKKFMGRTFDGVHRITFVIDETGTIEQVIKNVKAKVHTQQILAAYVS